jgi:thymidylate synthase (FAD)
MAHCVVAEAEAILDKEFPVLDKGFVRLVDYLGGDDRVVQAARVSYGAGTKTFRQDAALIDHLLRNKHTSPFEQVQLTYHVKLPIFVARQWIRHRTARVNEISGRYSVLADEFYVPAEEDIAAQSTDNRQGRSDTPFAPEEAEKVRTTLSEGQEYAYKAYTGLINEGVAREIARVNLPLSTYSQWYWQIDLHNLFHFLSLRLDPHAQREIRLYAEVLFDIAKKVAPLSCAAFERHTLHAVSFSGPEFAELSRRLDPAQKGEPLLTGKELARFEEKLATGRQS